MTFELVGLAGQTFAATENREPVSADDDGRVAAEGCDAWARSAGWSRIGATIVVPIARRRTTAALRRAMG